jgi:hypothetical protein
MAAAAAAGVAAAAMWSAAAVRRGRPCAAEMRGVDRATPMKRPATVGGTAAMECRATVESAAAMEGSRRMGRAEP